jgi:DNA invertase Pin-like site-specific DNA recombinase
MPPAVAYYRVSTERQRRSGLGIEAQQAAVVSFAETAGFSLIASSRRPPARAPTRSNAGRGSQVPSRRPAASAAR